MISFLIVGSGYRSEYFARVARRYPDLFRAMYLCRSQAKADLMEAHTGIPATMREAEALSFAPDFVVIAVDRGHKKQPPQRGSALTLRKEGAVFLPESGLAGFSHAIRKRPAHFWSR